MGNSTPPRELATNLLAPEHPYPAAIEDSVAVYRELLGTFRPRDILVAGESAGGGLCLALLLALGTNVLPLPCAAIAITPLPTDPIEPPARRPAWRQAEYRVFGSDLYHIWSAQMVDVAFHHL